MKLFLGTGNTHKVEEFVRLFDDAGLTVDLRSAREAGGMPHVDENAGSFAGNALLKAEALQKQLGGREWVLADDSGLEVAVLAGAPGVLSARYAGPDATDADNRRKLLERLEGIPLERKTARFVCVLALVGPGVREVFRAECDGLILKEEAGGGGFGYDPLFRPEGRRETFAEMAPEEKNRLSHRGRAVKLLCQWLVAR